MMMMMMQLPREHTIEATEPDVIEPLSDPDLEEEEEEEEDDTPNTRKKKRGNNKRRFSDEQVKSLETIFASETKLEPKKKLQVATELGLQPRQVAIWFQNKRARWKSKEIEKNYRVLKANYDSLKARFDTMKEEKESLLKQLEEVKSFLDKSHKGSSGSKDSVVTAELPVKSSSLQEELEQQCTLYSDDDKSGNMAHFGQDEPELEPELMQLSENIDSPLITWCSFDAANLFDQSSTSSYWWDSWT